MSSKKEELMKRLTLEGFKYKVIDNKPVYRLLESNLLYVILRDTKFTVHLFTYEDTYKVKTVSYDKYDDSQVTNFLKYLITNQ
jgi:hypothetical protein